MRMFLLTLLLAVSTTAEAVPLQLTQQGRLLEPSGAAVTGLHDLTFRIYDDPTSGVLLWEEVITVDFTSGYYAAVLGADEVNNPLDSAVLSMYPIYMELELDTNGPMSPRQAINSAPYSQMAGVAQNVDGGTVNASEVSINGSAVINGSGEWVGTINVDWNTQIVNMPSDIADGDDNTQLSESDVEDYVTNASIDLAAGSMMGGSTLLTVDDTITPDWSDVQNRPAGLDDGDDDTQLSESQVEDFVTNGGIDLDSTTTIGGMDILTTDSDSLGSLSCLNDGDVPHWDTALGWYCDADVDTTLSELEVEDFITNDAVDLAAGSMMDGSVLLTTADTLAPDWSDIQNRPAGLDDGDDDTQLSSTQVVGYVEAGSVNLATGSQVDGKNIVGQPSTCSDGQVLVYDATNNDWGCGDDTDTTLTPTEMQTAVEAMTLNLQNLPQVNGVDVLTADSTIDPTKIDSSAGTDGQVITLSSGVPTWTAPSSNDCEVIDSVLGPPTRLFLQCGSATYIVEGSSLQISSLSSENYVSGEYHCGLDSLNQAYCWGYNYDSILTIPSDSFDNLYSGSNHICGITTTGNISCWGADYHGQVSNAPSGSFTTLALGNMNGCGLNTTGNVECWGYDYYGQVSNAPSGIFSKISAGTFNTCALDSSGSITCWGRDNYGQVSNVPSGNFTEFGMGYEHGCALDISGTISCWGYDGSGEVSNSPSGTFSQLSVGNGSTCALDPSGLVSCWGNSSYIANMPSDTFTKLTAGMYHHCGLTSSGQAKCWGDYRYTGGEDSDKILPVEAIFSDISSGKFSNCGLTNTGNVICWGEDKYGQTDPP